MRIGIGQQGIDQNAKTFGIGVQIAQLRHRIDHAAAARAPGQAQHEVKRHLRRAVLLQQLDLGLHLLTVFIGLARKQKPPQATLLPAQGRTDNAVQDVAPVLRTAQPVLQARIAVQIVQARRQIGIGDEQLAGSGQLHRRAQNFPARIIQGHHLAGGIHIQIPDARLGIALAVGFLVQRFTQRADDFAARAAQANHQMIHCTTLHRRYELHQL